MILSKINLPVIIEGELNKIETFMDELERFNLSREDTLKTIRGFRPYSYLYGLNLDIETFH